MSDDKIVPIRGGLPPISDIPGQLRAMASAIERGDHEPLSSVMLLMPRIGKEPDLFIWGYQMEAGEMHLLLSMAQMGIVRGQIDDL